MLKYFHRLQNIKSGLLYDAYICNQNLYACNIQTWYSSIMYILDKLGIHVLNSKLGTLCNFAKDKLCDSFMISRNKNKQDILNGNNSKIDTYFSLKNCFDREKYTEINDFKIHYSLC